MPGLSLRAVKAVPSALLATLPSTLFGAGLLLALVVSVAAPAPPSVQAVDAQTGGTQQVELVQRGTALGDVVRTYVFTVPARESGPRPLVLALHGRAQTIDGLRRMTGLEALGEREGFVSVFPGGYSGVWNAGTCCVPTANPDMPDVEFLDQVVADVARRTVVDLSRVYVVGFSNGGMMAYRYACQRSSAVAGVGVVSGAMAASPDFADSGPRTCRPGSPVSLIDVHGARDTTVPYAGGDVAGSRGGSVAPVRGGVDQVAVGAGCTTGRSGRVGPTARVDWTGCLSGAAVRLVRIDGHGHGWTRDTARYGLDTTDTVWSFLKGRRASTAPPAA